MLRPLPALRRQSPPRRCGLCCRCCRLLGHRGGGGLCFGLEADAAESRHFAVELLKLFAPHVLPAGDALLLLLPLQQPMFRFLAHLEDTLGQLLGLGHEHPQHDREALGGPTDGLRDIRVIVVGDNGPREGVPRQGDKLIEGPVPFRGDHHEEPPLLDGAPCRAEQCCVELLEVDDVRRDDDVVGVVQALARLFPVELLHRERGRSKAPLVQLQRSPQRADYLRIPVGHVHARRFRASGHGHAREAEAGTQHEHALVGEGPQMLENPRRQGLLGRAQFPREIAMHQVRAFAVDGLQECHLFTRDGVSQSPVGASFSLNPRLRPIEKTPI
mmetsp:Transcript_128050/g.410346  ORF Transcript_128050/g.410346 Transcript_128050/m.410346 type:complete len:329 (-) Transcript_128050:214-1200(-)